VITSVSVAPAANVTGACNGILPPPISAKVTPLKISRLAFHSLYRGGVLRSNRNGTGYARGGPSPGSQGSIALNMLET